MKNITIKSIRDKQKETEEVAEKFFSKPKNDIVFEDANPKCKCGKFKCLIKIVMLTIFVLIFSGIGGIGADRFALPYLIAKYPQLNQYEFVKNINTGTTVVRVTENVNITEDKAIVDAIKKVSPSIVRISKNSATQNSEYSYAGNGIVLTSNGYIVTSSKIISGENETGTVDPKTLKKESADTKKTEISYNVTLSDGNTVNASIVSTDMISGLAIIKIEGNNLPVIPLADSDTLELGERLILIDDSIAIDIVSKFINDYRSPLDESKDPKSQKRIMIMKKLEDSYKGATVINIKGEIVGISEGGDLFIPTNSLKDFIKTVIK